jgi:hypothetical protein
MLCVCCAVLCCGHAVQPVERILLLREEAQMWRDLEAARRFRWVRTVATLVLASVSARAGCRKTELPRRDSGHGMLRVLCGCWDPERVAGLTAGRPVVACRAVWGW